MKKLTVVLIVVIVLFLTSLACGKARYGGFDREPGPGFRGGFGGFRGERPEMTPEMREKFEERRKEMQRKFDGGKEEGRKPDEKREGKSGRDKKNAKRPGKFRYFRSLRGSGRDFGSRSRRGFHSYRERGSKRGKCSMMSKSRFFGGRGHMIRFRGLDSRRGSQRGRCGYRQRGHRGHRGQGRMGFHRDR